MFIKVMAKEEPLITCMSLRPGIVDTDMTQSLIKNNPRMIAAIEPEQLQYLRTLHANGKYLPTATPGRILANLICLRSFDILHV